MARRKKRDSSKNDDKNENFIQDAISRPGALNKRVGGPAGQNLSKVEKLAESGSPLAKQQANFFLNVLRKKRKKKK